MKKIYLATAILALASLAAPAFAQKAPESYHLTLSPAETNLVGNALMQRPYSEVADVMNKLNDQIKKQNADANPTLPKPDEKPPAPPAKK